MKLTDGATCVYTISGPQRFMEDAEWNDIGRISMSAESYGEFKKFVEQACQKQDCKDLKKKLANIDLKLGIDGFIK